YVALAAGPQRHESIEHCKANEQRCQQVIPQSQPPGREVRPDIEYALEQQVGNIRMSLALQANLGHTIDSMYGDKCRQRYCPAPRNRNIASCNLQICNSMKTLVLGSDGRAHALVWRLFNSSAVTELVCAPGNGGTGLLVPNADLEIANVATV